MRRIVVAAGSPQRRRWLVDMLGRSDAEMNIVTEAADVPSTLTAVKRLLPDLLVLDASIPPTGAHDAVRQVMAGQPCPVVVVATEPGHATSTVRDRLIRTGALSVIDLSAPKDTEAGSVQQLELLDAVQLLAGMAVVGRRRPWRNDQIERAQHLAVPTAPGVVAVAASTGGPEALSIVLRALPADFSLPLLLVQHISPGFHETLVHWLDEQSPLTVRLAVAGELTAPGVALLAPSGSHLVLCRGGRIELDERDSLIDGHRPSATQLFRSVARVAGRSSIGVVLTGMGVDGCQGLLDLKAAGGHVIAQDEATSTVFGMAKEAVAAGAIDEILPLSEIAGALLVRAQRLTV